MPVVVTWIVIVRRNGDRDARALGGRKQLADVLDGIVLDDAFSKHAPAHAFGAEEVDLRIDHHQRGPREIKLHAGIGQRRLYRVCILGGDAVRIVAHDSGLRSITGKSLCAMAPRWGVVYHRRELHPIALPCAAFARTCRVFTRSSLSWISCPNSSNAPTFRAGCSSLAGSMARWCSTSLLAWRSSMSSVKAGSTWCNPACRRSPSPNPACCFARAAAATSCAPVRHTAPS